MVIRADKNGPLSIVRVRNHEAACRYGRKGPSFRVSQGSTGDTSFIVHCYSVLQAFLPDGVSTDLTRSVDAHLSDDHSETGTADWGLFPVSNPGIRPAVLQVGPEIRGGMQQSPATVAMERECCTVLLYAA